jgi:hypothetical protein
VTGLVDTDVIYKSSVYRLLDSFQKNSPTNSNQLAILAATRFVVTQKIKRKQSEQIAELALSHMNSALERFELLEPTDDETAMAESLEFIAAKANVNLDCGESQLCALLISRGFNVIFTGDKRAICAMEKLNNSEALSGALVGKISCLEQIVLKILEAESIENVRTNVCECKGTDKALESCFSCTATSTTLDNIREGLKSYINHITAAAPSVMKTP